MLTLYRLPDSLRPELQEPFGPVLQEDEVVARIRDGTYGRPVVTVGDVVSATLLRHKVFPDVLLYDLSTMRGLVGEDVRAILEGHPARLLEVRSPAAEITQELVMALKIAFESPMMTKIKVEGEEDLAGLPAIQACPLGGTVIYGMPNRGLVAVPVDAEAKDRVERLLSLMKVGDP